MDSFTYLESLTINRSLNFYSENFYTKKKTIWNITVKVIKCFYLTPNNNNNIFNLSLKYNNELILLLAEILCASSHVIIQEHPFVINQWAFQLFQLLSLPVPGNRVHLAGLQKKTHHIHVPCRQTTHLHSQKFVPPGSCLLF